MVALWDACRLTRPWNDAHKDIARKLAVQPELYEGHRGWVNYLAVAPNHRGRGCPKVSLLVRNSNTEALNFYRHLGYLQDESISLGKRLIADA